MFDLLHIAAIEIKRGAIEEFVNRYRIDVDLQDGEGFTIYDYTTINIKQLKKRITHTIDEGEIRSLKKRH